jgi:predicted acyl esterase
VGNPQSKKQNQGSKPKFQVIVEKDVPIIMPDGVRLFADVYRPSGKGQFPALLSYSTYGKEIQTPLDLNDWKTVSRAWMAGEAGNIALLLPII